MSTYLVVVKTYIRGNLQVVQNFFTEAEALYEVEHRVAARFGYSHDYMRSNVGGFYAYYTETGTLIITIEEMERL